MDPIDLLGLIWLFLVLWLVTGSMSGALTKKERLCIHVILGFIACTMSGYLIVTSGHWWSQGFWVLMSIQNVRNTIMIYKRWKNTDDDDDYKHRRKTWVKNHLPKPVTKQIPVPI